MPDPFVEPRRRGPDLASAIGWVMGLLGFLIGARPLTDNSFLTHLATGRLILETGSVPTVDPYSQASAGVAWTVQSWLVSVVYASLEAGAGLSAIRVFHGLLGLAIAVGVWHLTEPARSLVVRCGLTGLVLVIGTFLWSPRPLLLALVGLVMVLLVLQGRVHAAWLAPVFWVWVNSHGSFVLGGGLVAFHTLGALIDGRGLAGVRRCEIRAVVWTGIGTLLGAVGPLGPRLLWFPVELMGRNEALTNVAEWRSPTFRSPVEQLFLVLLVVVVAAAGRRAPWRALLPSLLFFIAGLLAVRNLGIGSIVIVGCLAPSLAGWVGSIDGKVKGPVPVAVSAIVAGVLAISVVSTAVQPAVDLTSYPVDDIDWLDERGLVARPGVSVAQRDFVGNYLHFRFGEDANVFMDDRFDFYPIETVQDHAGLLISGDKAEIVDRHGFDVILWETDTPLHRWLLRSSDWAIVRSGDMWIVACRRDSPAFAAC